MIVALLCAILFPTGFVTAQADVVNRVYHDIRSILKPIGAADILITFDDDGTTRYGVLHQDDSITPMYLLGRYAMQDLFFPNSEYQQPYEFGVFPNGDYYEQMTHDKLQEGAFRIISRDGELLYASNSAEAAEHIVGYTGDKIAVLRRVTGFLDSTWILTTIDHHGNSVGQEHDVGEWGIGIFNGEMKDLGFGYMGIAKAGNEDWNPHSFKSVFLDTNKDQCIIGDHWQTIRAFEEDTQTALWERAASGWSMDTEYYPVTVDFLANGATVLPNSWLNGVKNRTIAEGLFFDGEDAFYDYSGKLAFRLPDYGSKVTTLYVGKFQEGYAPLIMRGADSNCYITMLNRQGEAQYSPIRLKDQYYSSESDVSEARWYDSTYGLNNDLFVNNGYAFYQSDSALNIISPMGEESSFQRPSGQYYYGVSNGYVIFEKCLLRLSDPDSYIVYGCTITSVSDDEEWDDWDESGGVDYSEIWARTWTRMGEPETQIVITSLGNRRLHAEMTFYRMLSIEAEMVAYEYDILWFEDSDGEFQGELRIEPEGDGLLHLYMFVEDNNSFYDYFTENDFAFTSEELPDLRDYGWEPVEYPEPSDWTGHWVASADGHQTDLYITGYGQGYNFGIVILFDGALSYSAIGGSLDPWTVDFYAEDFNCCLSLNPSEHTITMFDPGSMVDEVNSILDLFHFEVKYTWADASTQPRNNE